ncbi:hypothetical protein OJ996_19360 [Luteolibacter sp. GHJ8]|uniref:Uncharacterized protein n=1 Tax=Luteolibacter rhizosphaerae TaxID=2989719 RepID=A0ABT3G7C8_9BACT|nr:hypothetical protein [Luteolibacter rhizosphaerae]MCW1915754.1 hypothetical protein [Luteolibacter rhizosphaerae]
MKFLLLALVVSVLFAGWQWLRPYEWSPDSGADHHVTRCLVERSHSNYWLRIFLRSNEGEEIDFMKPLQLVTADGRTHAIAELDREGSERAIDTIVLRFWLEEKDFAGPLSLQINDGKLSIRSGDTLPRMADGAFRVFNSTRW